MAEQSERECPATDYISIGNSQLTSDDLLPNTCGTSLPEKQTYISTGIQAVVKFKQTEDGALPAFVATYKAGKFLVVFSPSNA